MKRILKLLMWLIYHKGDQYIIKTYHYGELHYDLYHLIRIDYFFLFKYRRFVDKCSSLEPSIKKKYNWLFTYQNIKEIN